MTTLPSSTFKIISIDGNIGSGKSTLVENLKIYAESNPEGFHGRPILFLKEPVEEWETIKDENGTTMLQKFYENYPKHNSFTYDYGNKNSYDHNNNMNEINSQIRDRYYFGQRISSVPNRMKFQSASIPSSSSRISIDRNFDGKSVVHHPIGGNSLNAFAATPLTTKHYNPNPYAEFAKYLTQTYFKPWQEAQWAEKAVSKNT